MASTCISECINDIARTTPVRRRPPYVRFHSLPEYSDREFSFSGPAAGYNKARPSVVDSVSCRQIFLRSYTFSRKESVQEKTKKCLGKVRERVAVMQRSGSRKSLRKRSSPRASASSSLSKQAGESRRGKCLREVKKVSGAAFLSVFGRLMSCTTKVDVADHHGEYY